MVKYNHIPVLLKEVIENLDVKPGHKYIDATLGGGGYSFEIVKLGGTVLGVDVDSDAIEYVREKIKSQKLKVKSEGRLEIVHGNFRDIEEIAKLNRFDKVSGIVFDLGLSSFQIEHSGRGFSFLRDEPLDMRMDPSKEGIRAADIINTWKEEELYELFAKKGEELNARDISSTIISTRRVKPIKSTSELAGLIAKIVHRSGKIHPATKVFQALRIEVNNELVNLKKALNDSINLLESGGIIIVVSFHSLEDRITKLAFRAFESRNIGKVVTNKPISVTQDEYVRNRRSRSAKMRVFMHN